MKPVYHYNVIPRLPAKLEPLRELAQNLWWTWEPAARKLFRHLDTELWHKTNHSPVRMLQMSRQARLLEVAADEDFLKEMSRVHTHFLDYLNRSDTYGKTRTNSPLVGNPVAYFSAEFGFHESVPNYSGGLGILAGDHCKSASDLDLNFVAVGLLYRHGYFKQQINREGWQEAVSLNQSFHHLPITEVMRDGHPLLVSVTLLGREVLARIWELRVGRIKVFLLDTDISENRPEDRLITAELYGGDIEMRIRQETVLGVGGVRALHAMDIHPQVYHMNEGHSAFLSLERIARYVKQKSLDFYSALQVVAASNVFTTHTPVPAGNDVFPRDMMRLYFGHYADGIGLGFDRLFQFGQKSVNPDDEFSMTILALRTSRHANGVSKLHGSVSRNIWKDVWAGVPMNEVPIASVTNGVHIKTWVAPEFAAIYNQYVGADWQRHLNDPDYWRAVIDIPDNVLWETHQKLKARLIEFVRQKDRARRLRVGDSPENVRKANKILDPEVLTLGFARRFATYKRGNLLFSDPDRLRKLLNNEEHPVQFVFAGKAHPKDDGGKRLIQEVYRWTRQAGVEGRIVFIEDYDHYIGRRLYQGVDLWLNNPLRPLEASGTSGMKLPPNGGLNFSVLDGWWCEGYNGKNGWPIGPEITGGTREFQDEVDTESLYHILETQIVPLYYARPDGRLPVAWIQRMRESIRSVMPQFNTHRMVTQYAEELYEPAAAARNELDKNNCVNAIGLSAWKEKMRAEWPAIHIGEVHITSDNPATAQVGDAIGISARVRLGPVIPENVRVQAYFGEADDGVIEAPVVIDMEHAKKVDPEGTYLYSGTIPATDSGSYGFTVRVIPRHPHLTQAHELRLITWASG